jgi:hypothetical protein
LPGHDESTSNSGRRVFGSEDGNGRALEAHANTHEKTSDEELLPVLCDGATDGSENANDGRKEDGTTATKVEVAAVRDCVRS